MSTTGETVLGLRPRDHVTEALHWLPVSQNYLAPPEKIRLGGDIHRSRQCRPITFRSQNTSSLNFASCTSRSTVLHHRTSLTRYTIGSDDASSTSHSTLRSVSRTTQLFSVYSTVIRRTCLQHCDASSVEQSVYRIQRQQQRYHVTSIQNEAQDIYVVQTLLEY